MRKKSEKERLNFLEARMHLALSYRDVHYRGVMTRKDVNDFLKNYNRGKSVHEAYRNPSDYKVDAERSLKFQLKYQFGKSFKARKYRITGASSSFFTVAFTFEWSNDQFFALIHAGSIDLYKVTPASR